MSKNNRKQIPKIVRFALYDKYNHKCAYCGCEIEYKDMQIDHKIAIKGGTKLADDELNSIDNLLPACRKCNFYKGTFTIEQFRQRLITVLMPNLQKLFIYKLALKYGFIEEHIPENVNFYFEEER